MNNVLKLWKGGLYITRLGNQNLLSWLAGVRSHQLCDFTSSQNCCPSLWFNYLDLQVYCDRDPCLVIVMYQLTIMDLEFPCSHQALEIYLKPRIGKQTMKPYKIWFFILNSTLGFSIWGCFNQLWVLHLNFQFLDYSNSRSKWAWVY